MNRGIDEKNTKQVILDSGVHKLVKIKATEAGETIRAFLEGILADILCVKKKKG